MAQKELNMSIKRIREVILANRGGLNNASDAEIMTIWNSLPPEIQKQYEENTKERKGKNAAGNKAESDL